MGCCDSFQRLGCFDVCATIETGLTAAQTGTHTYIFHAPSGILQTTADLTTGDDIDLNIDKLNENMRYVLEIVQPDGTQLGDTCYDFVTESRTDV